MQDVVSDSKKYVEEARIWKKRQDVSGRKQRGEMRQVPRNVEAEGTSL
jgi:hypothetical protein